ncbi:hypothetical protein [Streptomyces sp. NPDC059459]|uniref:hypothetical protein n=1 Tax=unclassified Streptomyces TaxID=2593676 RepID=UPI00367AC39C
MSSHEREHGRARRGEDPIEALLRRVNCNDRRETHGDEVERAALKARWLAAVTYLSAAL